MGGARSASDADADEAVGVGESARGGWKSERTFSTIDRARFGCTSGPRAGETSDWRTVPLGEAPGTGMGSGRLSAGLGRTEDTEEQRDASGGESRDNASGLRTDGERPACSAFICAMAVEIAGAMDAGCFL